MWLLQGVILGDSKLNIDTLNQQFGIEDVVVFDEKTNEQVVVKIHNIYGQAEIMLQGAHLIHWQPVNQHPVIWLSDEAIISHGKSIRGGIPICWPWFGAHVNDSRFPSHGYARTTMFQPVNFDALADGRTKLEFILLENEDTKKLWPFDTELRIEFVLGSSLEINLLTKNNSDERIEISEALHTYFQVDDIRKASITGLDECRYLDKPDNFSIKQQVGPVVINEEVDRIYVDTVSDVSINDPVLDRRILISKQGSHSTVVWNPWKIVADSMGDLGDDGFLNMVCIESANAADNALSIGSGETHCLSVQYSVEKNCI